MLRRILLAAADSARLRHLATTVPAATAVAGRFVAGDALDDALEAVAGLNARGLAATLDYLGESVHDERVARDAHATYRSALAAIARRRLDCSLSLKLTQLGLRLDADLCRDLVADVADEARRVGTHVTVDMESSAVTQQTVDLVLALRAAGHANVGCAVQTYLHRTPGDVRRLAASGASIRVCKGAYDEDDDVALQDDRAIADAFVAVGEQLLPTGTFPRFATHDHRVVHRVRNAARRLCVPGDAYEFQQLYGVREPLQRELAAIGHHVRVYVPFGEAWYPYLVRRLAERPANLAFFLRALAGRRDHTAATGAPE